MWGTTGALVVLMRAHPQRGLHIERRSTAEPPGLAGVRGIPGLVDQAAARSPGMLFTKCMETVCCFCVQPHAEVVPEQAPAPVQQVTEGLVPLSHADSQYTASVLVMHRR